MKFGKLGVVLCAAAIAIGALAGCGGGADGGAKTAAGKDGGTVLAVGSSALQPLAQQAAKDYMSKNSGVKITVQGGGSGTGLSQIAAGSVQIGNSDVFAEAKKIDAKDLVDNKVAVVGMGPVVNKDVKVDSVSQKDLIGIFTGKITNWKEVGGQDLPIVVINRAEGSGTRATFEEFGLKKNKAMKAQEQDNSGAVEKIVSSTPGAISYLAFSYYNDKTKALKVDGVAPTSENVATNSWKIWSYEHMYTRKNADKNTTDFIKYIMSDDVQKNLVPKLGYIPVNIMKYQRDAQGAISPVK